MIAASDSNHPGWVYILEFSQPLGNDKHSARTYVGWCEENRFLERFEQHKQGKGAAITRAAVQRGIHLTCVTIFPGTRKVERRIKNLKNTPKLIARIRREGSYGQCPF